MNATERRANEIELVLYPPRSPKPTDLDEAVREWWVRRCLDLFVRPEGREKVA